MAMSKCKPEISVIVPIYKVEAFLPRCVDSILNQSFSDFELILVDDESPDRCGIICDEYAEKDSRITVIHRNNAKLSEARNAGMNIASGTWISFIDPDDWIHKDYLKILMSGVLKDTDVVICDCLVTSSESEDDSENLNVVFKSVSIDEVYANHTARTRAWGKVYKRDIVGDFRFISGTEPAEDSCFNELFFEDNMKYRMTDAKLYYYFMRPGSAISQMGRRMLNPVYPLLDRLPSIEKPAKRKRIITRCYKYIFAARYGEMFADDYSDVKKNCKELLHILAAYRSELDKKEQIIMRVLSASPLLYRLWRIKDDPTLLQYEKTQRKLKRERRK